VVGSGRGFGTTEDTEDTEAQGRGEEKGGGSSPVRMGRLCGEQDPAGWNAVGIFILRPVALASSFSLCPRCSLWFTRPRWGDPWSLRPCFDKDQPE
jgi:hypothetical protein